MNLPKSIAVVGHSLLMGGIVTFLSDVEGYDISVLASDDKELLQKLISVHPTIVLIDSSDDDCHENLAVGKLLESLPGLLLILIDSKENQSFIVKGERLETNSVADLLGFIELKV